MECLDSRSKLKLLHIVSSLHIVKDSLSLHIVAVAEANKDCSPAGDIVAKETTSAIILLTYQSTADTAQRFEISDCYLSSTSSVEETVIASNDP